MQVPVFLAPFNHAYAAIDSKTYELLSTNEALRQLAHLEVRTTTDSKGQIWSGIYLLGKSTYFEFLRDDSLGGLNPEFSGFAVSPESNGGIGECVRRLGETGSDVTYRVVSRQEAPTSIPWFYMAFPEQFPERGKFEFWCMQYQPNFLREWKPTVPPHSGIGRRDILDKYRNHLSLRGRPALSDVIALTVNLEPTQLDSLKNYLSALGWEASGAPRLQGPDGFIINLRPEASGRYGLRAVTFRAEGLLPRREALGTASLTIFEESAVLEW